ncbi:MAG: MBL fold metallo-hydrolase [Lentisphaeria bacterium]|nr:MBL fold metallo-hydrolase [Lentisphaeria bacterium]
MDRAEIDLLFTGTGAADWLADNEPVRAENGERRLPASLLVDGHVLIDCGPGVVEHAASLGLCPQKLTDVVYTHGHPDHFCVSELQRLACAHASRGTLLTVHAHPVLRQDIDLVEGVVFRPVLPGGSLCFGELSATALSANHQGRTRDEQPLHYVFSKGETAFLYATDGAWLSRDTWTALLQMHLDAVIWDATTGFHKDDARIFEHNSVQMVELMLGAFVRAGVLKEAHTVLLTHLARTLCPAQADLVEALAGTGIGPARDGMRLVLAHNGQ